MRAGIYSAVVGFMWLTGAKGEEWTKVWQVQARPELRVTAGDASVSVEVGSDREI